MVSGHVGAVVGWDPKGCGGEKQQQWHYKTEWIILANKHPAFTYGSLQANQRIGIYVCSSTINQ